MVPLCSSFVVVCSYAEREAALGRGLVANALSAEMKALLRQFLLLVAQLETQVMPMNGYA